MQNSIGLDFAKMQNGDDFLPDLIDVEPKGCVVPQYLREECQYTRQYCEENVWLLCQKFLEDHPTVPTFAVWISNPNRTVAVWQQKISSDEDTPVVWDYHVVLLADCGQRRYIYDIDTTLPFPCEATFYTNRAFRPDAMLRPSYRQKFRVVPAQDFINHFASDRRHMNLGGRWIAPPPSYPCIKGDLANTDMNLGDWMNMVDDVTGQSHQGMGKILELTDFISLCDSSDLSSIICS